MEFLATVSYPSINPVGINSVAAVVVCVGLGVAVWKSKLSRVAVVPALVLPLVISGLSWGTMVYFWWHSSRGPMPNLNDFLTGYIYVGFGFGCALAAVRKGRGWVRYLGAAFMVIYCLLIVREIIDNLNMDLAYRISKLIVSI